MRGLNVAERWITEGLTGEQLQKIKAFTSGLMETTMTRKPVPVLTSTGRKKPAPPWWWGNDEQVSSGNKAAMMNLGKARQGRR